MDDLNLDSLENSDNQPVACAFNADCPTRLILNRIADKWTVLVVILLEKIDHLEKALIQTLRGLERDGLVSRKVYATVPPKVEYALTPLGHTLKEMLYAIKTWSETNIKEVLAAQKTYDELN